MSAQTRAQSLVEATVNTAIGFAVSFVAWPVAAWLFSIDYTPGQHWSVVAFFTAISVARSYIVRRFFNSHIGRFSKWITNSF